MADDFREVFMESPPRGPDVLTSEPDDLVAARRRKPWRDKFRAALRGMKLGVRGHSSFAVHFFFAALVIAAGFVLLHTAVEWCVILGCIGLVLVAELFNSAIETMFRALDESARERAWPALDIAAGAVLLASLFAAVLGCVVFIPKLAALLFPS